MSLCYQLNKGINSSKCRFEETVCCCHIKWITNSVMTSVVNPHERVILVFTYLVHKLFTMRVCTLLSFFNVLYHVRNKIKTFFAHWPHVLLSWFTSSWWHHNKLLMMLQMLFMMQQLWRHGACEKQYPICQISFLFTAIFTASRVWKVDFWQNLCICHARTPFMTNTKKLQWACDYLSMLGLKLNLVSKRSVRNMKPSYSR